MKPVRNIYIPCNTCLLKTGFMTHVPDIGLKYRMYNTICDSFILV